MSDDYMDIKEWAKAKRDFDRKRKTNNMNGAFDDGGWTKHNEFHWSRILQGQKLQYWPSTNKFQHGNGRIMYGGIEGYIRKRS